MGNQTRQVMLLMVIIFDAIMLGVNAGQAVVSNDWVDWLLVILWILSTGIAVYAYMRFECVLLDVWEVSMEAIKEHDERLGGSERAY